MEVGQKELKGRMERFERACRAAGVRVTHQRLEIFRVLAQGDEHPDAETVYRQVRRQVPTVSLDTVYRTLGSLEALGVVHKVPVEAGKARYDANQTRHHHFVCQACGDVYDVVSERIDAVGVGPEVEAVGTVESWQVQYRGLCRRCAGREAPRHRGDNGNERKTDQPKT